MNHPDYTLGTAFINIICPRRLPKHRSHGKIHTHTHTGKQGSEQSGDCSQQRGQAHPLSKIKRKCKKQPNEIHPAEPEKRQLDGNTVCAPLPASHLLGAQRPALNKEVRLPPAPTSPLVAVPTGTAALTPDPWLITFLSPL